MQPEWKISKDAVDYNQAVSFMEARVAAIRNNNEENLVWLLEHSHLYTAGTSANKKDLLRDDLPVFKTGRGGQYTYHGKGQRIAYVMVDLKKYGRDVRKYIYNLEEWIIKTLNFFGINGERREGRVGIWVCSNDGSENKIAAIGVRIRKWVSYHGVAINLNPDLSYYEGIIPCGIKEYGVTSIEKQGVKISMQDLDEVLQKKWGDVF